MKKVIVIAMLALVLAFGSTASAFAASYANYGIIAPRFAGMCTPAPRRSARIATLA